MRAQPRRDRLFALWNQECAAAKIRRAVQHRLAVETSEPVSLDSLRRAAYASLLPRPAVATGSGPVSLSRVSAVFGALFSALSGTGAKPLTVASFRA